MRGFFTATGVLPHVPPCTSASAPDEIFERISMSEDERFSGNSAVQPMSLASCSSPAFTASCMFSSASAMGVQHAAGASIESTRSPTMAPCKSTAEACSEASGETAREVVRGSERANLGGAGCGLLRDSSSGRGQGRRNTRGAVVSSADPRKLNIVVVCGEK